jgi:hypothetical protein
MVLLAALSILRNPVVNDTFRRLMSCLHHRIEIFALSWQDFQPLAVSILPETLAVVREKTFSS